MYIRKTAFLLSTFFISSSVFANPLTMADVAETLISGTHVVTHFMVAACLILGVGMVLYALVQYRFHRQNPKFVPLDRPILFAILGAILITIPFFSRFGIQTGSALDIKKQQVQTYIFDIDAPMVTQK